MKLNITKKTLALAFALSLVAVASNAQSRKGVSILGDSYSTYENYVEPKENQLWYFQNPIYDRTDVDDVTQTWWHQFITQNGYRLVQNNAYAGSTVCNTGYGGDDYSNLSFIARMDNLGSPDMILIFGATNDSFANSPLGEFVWSDWTPEQLKSFRPALTYMLSHMKKRYINTEIIYIINDTLKPEITSSIIEACDRYEIPYVLLHDIDIMGGHPTKRGMNQIVEQLNAALTR